jgi:uncharacterized protein YjbI with pentapeptide repeats
MANEEQLAILRRGVDVWNNWREENPYAFVDLRHANLSETDLRGANLSRTDLAEANLDGTNLRRAFLSQANLRKTLLKKANLKKALLVEANLNEANLSNANFSQATLYGASLQGALLIGSNFFRTYVGDTIFANSDLSQIIGLEQTAHNNPSFITTDTFVLSKGNIPKVFLRGCGLSDWEIESIRLYDPDLSNDDFINIQNTIFDLRRHQALQVSSLFISYNHGDGAFVDKLENYLNDKGIRFWRDIHDATAGRLEKVVNRAMRLNPTVLLILSQYSLKSDWVEHEVRTARELEKEIGRDVLCPVALDDSWKNSSWPKRIMEQVMEYNILDFSNWTDDSKFENTFNKLIDGLELFYQKK